MLSTLSGIGERHYVVAILLFVCLSSSMTVDCNLFLNFSPFRTLAVYVLFMSINVLCYTLCSVSISFVVLFGDKKRTN